METAEQQQKQKGPVLETMVKQLKTLSHDQLWISLYL
jgi:hypothetical protein